MGLCGIYYTRWFMKSINKTTISLIIIILISATIFLGGCPAKMPEAKEIEVIISDDGQMRVYSIEGYTHQYGMVFYVGTLLSPDKYDDMMKKIAYEGYMVVTPYLAEGLSIAMGDYMAMDRVIERYPDVEFVLSGHSLGGIALNQYVNRKPENVNGIIYYASRPFDLKIDYIPCLTIIATNDNIIPMDTILNTPGYPIHTSYYLIEGGNHMAFSTFEIALGGTLEITREDQINQSANETINFLNRIFKSE